MKIKFYQTEFKILCLFLFFFIVGCISPEEPKYEFKEGLIYVDAFATTTVGNSFVIISEPVLKLEAYINEFIRGALVTFENMETGLTVALTEQIGIYTPPNDFVVSPGEVWELNIVLPNGKQYRSRPEKVVVPTNSTNIKATYTPELLYKTDLKRFAAGHIITIDVDDPQEEENFYLWKYRSFEKLLICESCNNQIFRNGKCINVNIGPNVGLETNFGNSDYFCEETCWRIRFNENVQIISDEFATGGTIENVIVGEVPLYTKENTLIELQQFSLPEKTYDYYKILKDIVNNSSGLNAPPPAALIGNIFNPADDEEYILGRFTAASSTIQSVFIKRESISESTIDPPYFFNTECYLVCGIKVCDDPSLSCDDEITFTSCTETRFRTGIKPVGWID